MDKLKTMLCAITTPFNNDFSVDFDGFKKNIDWLIAFAEQICGISKASCRRY